MQPLDPRDLGQDHGSEFAGTDQRGAHGTPLGRAAQKQSGKIHDCRGSCAAVLPSGVKLCRPREEGAAGSMMTPVELPLVRFSKRDRERLLI